MPFGLVAIGKDPLGNDVFALTAIDPTSGGKAPAHAIVDPDGAYISVATEGTLQDVLDAIQALTSQDAGLATQATLAAILQLLTDGILTTDRNGAAFGHAVAMTAGDAAIAAGRSVEILCSVGGDVVFSMAGGGTHKITIGASALTQTFPYSATGIVSAGTTATATYANLS